MGDWGLYNVASTKVPISLIVSCPHQSRQERNQWVRRALGEGKPKTAFEAEEYNINKHDMSEQTKRAAHMSQSRLSLFDFPCEQIIACFCFSVYLNSFVFCLSLS